MCCTECGHGWTFARLRAIADPAAVEPGVSRLLAMKAQEHRRFIEAPYSPFALDDRWTGLRSFGGWGGSNGGTDRLSLAHGELFIAITAKRWPLANTGLFAVSDFDVYADGSREIVERMPRRPEEGQA